MRFLMLLKLTPHGRQHAESAAASLRMAAEEVLPEAGGVMTTWFMTFGQYDAVITGTCDESQQLAGFAAWINEQGYFESETLTGFDSTAYKPTIHG